MKPLRFLLIFVCFASFLVSCAADMYSKTGPYGCHADHDCDPGQACGPQGICMLVRDPVELPLGIEIYDQRTSSPLQGQLVMDLGPTELVPDAEGIVRITVPDPFTIEGRVRTQNNDSNAQALFLTYRLSHIPGRGVTSSSQTLGAVHAGGVPYSMRLVQPDFYVLQVIPQPATQLAPLVSFAYFSGNTQVDFTLGVENFEVIGRLVDAQGNPVTHATVWIFDFETGASSTVAQSSSEPGHEGEFRVYFTNEPLSLSIFTGPGNTGIVMPSVLFEVSTSQVEEWKQVHGHGSYHTGDLEFPALAPPITFGTNVFGFSGSGSREVVSGARVTFQSVVGGGTRNNGVIIAEGTTNEEGNVTVSLVPGEFETGRLYEVTITTPLDSPFASTKKTLEVGPVSGYGESVELERRITAIGQVLAPETGAPLSQVMIKASPSTNSTGLPIAEMIDAAYQPSTQTDSSGWFSMLLDPGYYDFSLIFPDRLKYPNTTIHDQIVAQLQDTVPFLFKPPTPSLVKFVLQDGNGVPLQNLEVRAFLVAPECPLAGECTIPAQHLYSSRTDTEGKASIIVP